MLRCKLRRLRGKKLGCWCDQAGACHAKILVELADVPYAEKLRDDFDKWIPHVTRACSVIEKIYSGTVNRGDEKGKGVLVRTVTMLDNMEKKWATLSVAAARFGVVLSDKGGKRRRGGAQRSS